MTQNFIENTIVWACSVRHRQHGRLRLGNSTSNTFLVVLDRDLVRQGDRIGLEMRGFCRHWTGVMPVTRRNSRLKLDLV